MRREQAREVFVERVPERFIADTAEAERPQIAEMIDQSRTFFQNCADYRVVAEVVEATRCMAGLRVGDRYVIQGASLVPAETTGPACIFMLSMLVQRVSVAFDRFAREGTMTLTLPGAQCTDPGPAVGGFGGVKLRLSIEPTPE